MEHISEQLLAEPNALEEKASLEQNIKKINIDDLDISKLNVRKINDLESIQNLADNIKKNGLLNPLTVIFNKTSNKYDIIAGQRRYHALKKNNMVSVACNILNETMSEQDQVSISLIENVQRVNMSLSERVKTYKKLHIEYNNDSTKLSNLINISKATIDKYLKISHLPDKILDRLNATNNDKISLDYAVDLAKLNILGDDREEKLEKIINLINDVSLDDRNKLRKCIINVEKYNGCDDFDIYFKKLIGKKKEYLTNKERLEHEKKEEELKYKKYITDLTKNNVNTLSKDKIDSLDANNILEKNTVDKLDKKIILEEEKKIQDKIKCELLKNKNLPYIIATEEIRNPLLQNYYREGLINRYKTCIISGMHMEVCEASHIIPFSESKNFDIDNGILLNLVLHKLFDKYYWSINPSTLCVEISNKCDEFEFLQEYNNKYINILEQYDNTKYYLKNHYDIFILKNNSIKKNNNIIMF
jgi:ParB/RepB/Spo0J family partition protein